MPARKRTRTEMEASEPPVEKKEPSLLQKIRNTWEFSATMQFIYLFGKVVKIDEDFDVEDFEEECLKPGSSEKLEEIGLTLLKWISSHRGLTYDIWDEYVRRQYLAKAPHLNPYGNEEEPQKFRNFDVFQRIRILHQLTVWTFWNPDRIRERMPEHQKEGEQVEWRMEPFGWDSDEREYYVLDDNRMYRRTEPPLPVVPKAKPKLNTIKARAARRRSGKRRKLEDEEVDSEAAEDGETSHLDAEFGDVNENKEASGADTYGGYKWECVAISLDDFNQFLDTIKKTKDPNEKELRSRIVEDVLPVIEAAAEKQRRKQERREKDLMLLEKMAGAKRSSRLADKHDRERKEREEDEIRQKKAVDLAAAHREQERQQTMEEERRSRMMTREQRIKDREYRRLLVEEELARDAEEQKLIEEGEKRGSERHLKERIEKNKKDLEDLATEEDWTFDCAGCGMHGKNYDDGSHSIACERCNVWQHSKCLGVSKSAAEKDDFHFVCADCRRKEEDAKRPKIMLKFGSGQSSSPPLQHSILADEPQHPRLVSVDIPKAPMPVHFAQEVSVNGLPTTQSPIHRPTAPTPDTQMQFGMVDAQRSSTSPQLTRVMPLHGPSSPLQQPQKSGWMHRSQQLHHASNGSVLPHSTHSGSVHSTTTNRTYPGQPTFAPVQTTPRPPSAHGAINGSSAFPRRIPSPIINRPTMSPTQGNPEVGPIAGVPGSSPSSYHPALFTPNINGVTSRPGSQEQLLNGHQSNQSSSSSPYQSFISQSPNPAHFSGLSPVKPRVNSPLPPPSNIPEKQLSKSTSPPAPGSNAITFGGNNMNNTLRSVSGTPIFPPTEKLAPSPEHIYREPVPTPSKQPSPPMVNAEFRRTSGDADMMHGIQTNGNNVQPQHTPVVPQPPTQPRPALFGLDQARQS